MVPLKHYDACRDFQFAEKFRDIAKVYYEGPSFEGRGKDGDFGFWPGNIVVKVNSHQWTVADVCSSGKFYRVGGPHSGAVRPFVHKMKSFSDAYKSTV